MSPVACDPERPAAEKHSLHYFDLWTYDGTSVRIHHALYVRCREQEQREAIIDSQSVISAEKGGLHRSARLRCRQEAHILVDKLGGLLQMAAIKARNSPTRSRKRWCMSTLKSSNDRIRRSASNLRPNAGLSNAHCLAQSMPQACQGLGEPQSKGVHFLCLASIRLMLRKLCNPA